MNQSEQINELTTALAKAQGEMKHAVKDSRNPHFKSSYADLASVWQACREPLSKYGLAIIQTLDIAGDKQMLITTLSHISGQWIKSTMALPIQRPGAQEIGSCLSYCRRYALAAIVGVYQDDDDAESAEGRGNENSTQEIQEDPGKISVKQKGLLEGLLVRLKDSSYEQKVCEKHKLSSIYDIPRFKFTELVEHIKSKIQEKTNAA